VLFIDDDIMPTTTLIAEHIHTHNAAGVDNVVLGPMLTPTDFTLAPWVHWEQAMLLKQYAEMTTGQWQPTARQFYTGNASIARHHLLAVGGFDHQFRRAEDVELAYRLADRGLTFVFNPNAIGYHYAERSFASWLRTPYEYGRNDVTFAHMHGQSWLLQATAREFHTRHWMVRALAFDCLSRDTVAQGAIQGLRALASLAAHCGLERIATHAYSGIFNLQYYQGMADALGGREPFLQLLEQAATCKPAFRLRWSGR
jgi:GT2 family glycosyltransferase